MLIVYKLKEINGLLPLYGHFGESRFGGNYFGAKKVTVPVAEVTVAKYVDAPSHCSIYPI